MHFALPVQTHTRLRSGCNRSKPTARYFLQLQGGGVTVRFAFLYRYCLCPTKLISWTTYGWWSSTQNILPSSAVPCEVVLESLSARARELWCSAEKPTAQRGSEFIWDVATHSSTLAWKIPWTEEPGRLQSTGSLSRTRLSDFTFTFHFHALEKAMATHSSVLAWRIPGMAEPGGLPSLGSHRVGHD